MSISRLPAALLLVVALALPTPSPAAQTKGPEGTRPSERPLAAPEVSCEACLVVADTGDDLWRRAAATELPNASTTKMMTAILAARELAPTEEVEVSAGAASTGGGGLDLEAGEVWPAASLLYALLLSSSNDAAVALAEHVAGSEAAFVDRMNSEAASLGLRHTAFVTPHGLDAAGHYSSAGDLAAIAEVLLDDPLLSEIVADREESVDGPRGSVLIENRNLLLETYPGAVGIKTGYTMGAGNALVSAATRKGRTVIAVVLRSEDSFADTAALLDYGFARLRRTVLLDAGSRAGSIVLDPAGSVSAVTERAVRGLAPPGTVEYLFERAGNFELPIEDGEVVGSVSVTSEGEVIDEVNAVARGGLESRRPSWAVRGLATVLSWGQLIASPAG